MAYGSKDLDQGEEGLAAVEESMGRRAESRLITFYPYRESRETEKMGIKMKL